MLDQNGPCHTHTTNECKIIIIIIIINTGRTCDHRSHLIGLPGQVGVPTNSNNLDDGQPTSRRRLYMFDLDAVHQGV